MLHDWLASQERFSMATGFFPTVNFFKKKFKKNSLKKLLPN
jgi:hypothetical protein